MALPIDLNPHWLASSAGYQIERSLRFNSADSAYLNRTPAGSGTLGVWTFSFWVKRAELGVTQTVFFSGTTNQRGGIRFTSGDLINCQPFNSTGANASWTSTAVFRDPSAWYHVVIRAFSSATGNSFGGVELALYINGVQQTFTLSTVGTPTGGDRINDSQAKHIGQITPNGDGDYLSAYLTEFNFIDGQALTPSSFGETDSATGVWKPKEYTGTYGTNGFYLNFSDNSSTTSTTLGKDYSGNGNNWTPNGFSIGTIASKTLAITDATKSGNVTLSATIVGSGTVNLTGFGGAGNLSGTVFTGLSSITGFLSDWGTHTVYKNGVSLFTVQGGKVYNDGGSQTATQTRTAQTVTQTGVSVSNGDVISIAFGVNSSVTVYYGYPGGAPSLSITAAGGAAISDPAGNDILVDTPTPYGTDTGVGGSVRGNYATLNPLASNGTLSNGNLDGTTGSGGSSLSSTIAMKTGKWYFEAVMTAKTSTGAFVGIVRSETLTPAGAMFEDGNFGYGYYSDTGNIYYGSSASNIAYGSSWGINDVIGCAFDADAGTLVFYKNGVSQGTYSSVTTGYNYLFGVCEGQGSATATFTVNFGQRTFAYTAPSGFKALCTQNLPTPTIGATSTTQANDYMNVVLWTGNGSTQNITGVGFQPDFVWAKKRSGAESHGLYDAVRGASNRLVSNSTAAAVTDAGVSAFLSDGFSISGANSGVTNDNGATYVGWNWNAGGSTVTNTSGTISAQVRASTTSGFSIVTYTGTGSAATVGHGLGVAPSFVIVKFRTEIENWYCYHASIGNTKAILLNTTGAATGASATYWNNTTPTSSVVSLGATTSAPYTYVMYAFAPVAGYSAFGSYVGNGSASGDGPFVYTGFRPRYILAKVASNQINATNWQIWDALRPTYNVASDYLFANASDAESNTAPSYHAIDFLSNGFKLRSVNTYGFNQSGATYIYMAFAENPFKYSLAR